jgi:hypothetical protein
MKITPLILFLLAPISLLASQILSYNIYDRTDRSDVMLTFDTPYHGVIKQSITKNRIILKLKDVTIESPKIKKVNSHFLHSLIITPLEHEVQIVAKVPQNIKVVVSKTSDAYGLRLRFISKQHATYKNSNTQLSQTQQTPNLSALPTKKEQDLSFQYIVVVTLLIAGIGFLLYIRKKMPQKNKKAQTKEGWLFQENKENTSPQKEMQNTPQAQNKEEVTIRFQKVIDQHNSVVMLDYGHQSYLVLIGNGHTLLDKFVDDKPTTQSEFESILQSRHEELEQFLSADTPNTTPQETHYDPLNSYKEKASLFPPLN